MKRSRSLKLGLLSGAAPLLLAACGNDAPHSYTNLQDCLKDPRQDPGTCQGAYDRARAAHLAGAERFPNRAACEKASGISCESAAADSSAFVPRMAGFVVEPRQRLSGGGGSWWNYAAAYALGSILGGGGSRWEPRPIYRDDGRSGGWDAGSSSRSSGWSAPEAGSSGRISTSTLSRGGFGGAAAARSSWGG